MRIRVATANMAGGARANTADPKKYLILGELLAGADLLALQEVIRCEDPLTGQVIRDDAERLKTESKRMRDYGYRSYFLPYLDSAQQPHPDKWNSDKFREWSEKGRVMEGTAILVKGGHLFSHQLYNDRPGLPWGQVLPWDVNKRMYFRGGRDTSPRTLLMARVQIGNRFVVFCSIHLSCLKEEDKDSGRVQSKDAVSLRRRQVEWIVDYLVDYRKARGEFWRRNFPGDMGSFRDDCLVVAGDFNTTPDSEELSALTTEPLNLEPAPIPATAVTRRNRNLLIDHMFASPNTFRSAEVIDLERFESPGQGTVSDHNPVVAELDIGFQRTAPEQSLSAEVMARIYAVNP